MSPCLPGHWLRSSAESMLLAYLLVCGTDPVIRLAAPAEVRWGKPWAKCMQMESVVEGPA